MVAVSSTGILYFVTDWEGWGGGIQARNQNFLGLVSFLLNDGSPSPPYLDIYSLTRILGSSKVVSPETTKT